MQNSDSYDLIDEFFARYQREVFYYELLAKECADLCRKGLTEGGIKAIVTHRAKDPLSLYNKLLKRKQTNGYNSIDEIRDDIKDLAGVRIALLFVDNMTSMDEILKKYFEVIKTIDHRKNQIRDTFADYQGVHYILKSLKSNFRKLGPKEDLIEVQVMSVLHGVWAEIQHDIEYKPQSFVTDEVIKQDLHDLYLYLSDGEEKVKKIYQGYLQRGVQQRGYLENVPLKKVPISSLIKGESPTPLYWYAQDSRRYVFPTERTLTTWFPDSLPQIYQLENQELQHISIGGNVTYKPGVRLVKLATDPKIFAIEKGGIMRWIKSESVLEKLYGKNWQEKVDILPDPFFVNYSSGPDIETVEDHNPEIQRSSVNEKDIGCIQPDCPCIFKGDIIENN